MSSKGDCSFFFFQILNMFVQMAYRHQRNRDTFPIDLYMFLLPNKSVMKKNQQLRFFNKIIKIIWPFNHSSSTKWNIFTYILVGVLFRTILVSSEHMRYAVCGNILCFVLCNKIIIIHDMHLLCNASQHCCITVHCKRLLFRFVFRIHYTRFN